MVLEEEFNHLEEPVVVQLIVLIQYTLKQLSYRLCLEDFKNSLKNV